jgi:hypothetical protein
LANTLWAFATVGARAPTLFGAVAKQSERLAREGNTQNWANAVWAFAAAGQWEHNGDRLKVLWHPLCELSQRQDIHEKQAAQMLQVAWAAKVEAPELKLADMLPPLGAPAFNQAMMQHTEMSSSHKHVSACLDELGWSHENEVCVDDKILGRILALDMARASDKVAVEFDGPSHYVTIVTGGATSGRAAAAGKEELRENGSTAFKARVLRAAGWRLVSIPYLVWDALRSKQDRVKYLCDQMAKVGITLKKVTDQQLPTTVEESTSCMSSGSTKTNSAASSVGCTAAAAGAGLGQGGTGRGPGGRNSRSQCSSPHRQPNQPHVELQKRGRMQTTFACNPQRMPLPPVAPAPIPMPSFTALVQEVDSFVGKYNLDEDCARRLRDLDPQRVIDVIRSAIGNDTQNASALISSRINWWAKQGMG